jgi:cell division protein FtsB
LKSELAAAEKLYLSSESKVVEEIEQMRDPELLRARARLAYCEEICRAGEKSEENNILFFMKAARNRFNELRDSLLLSSQSRVQEIRERLAKVQQVQATLDRGIEKNQRELERLRQCENETQTEINELSEQAKSAKLKLAELQRPIRETQAAIQNVITRRNINVLCHFTHIRNIPSILSNGILPRTEVERRELQSTFSDSFRFDGLLSSVSVSISFPNYRMLYRKTGALSRADYCICLIDPSILWKQECLFSPYNAARNGLREVILQRGWSAAALEMMFDDIPMIAERAGRSLPISYPTDPQAEVMVPERIPAKSIIAIAVQPQVTPDQLQRDFGWTPDTMGIVSFDNRWFSRRIDSVFWR